MGRWDREFTVPALSSPRWTNPLKLKIRALEAPFCAGISVFLESGLHFLMTTWKDCAGRMTT
jgi:hypothetical protein